MSTHATKTRAGMAPAGGDADLEVHVDGAAGVPTRENSVEEDLAVLVAHLDAEFPCHPGDEINGAPAHQSINRRVGVTLDKLCQRCLVFGL